MSRTNKWAVLFGLVVAAAGIALLQPQLGVQAQDGCSLATLQGSYIWSYDGYFVDGEAQTPYAYAGREVYDGAGNLTGVYSGSDNGEVVRSVVYSGTYTVNDDCTGTLITVEGVGEDELVTSFDIFIDAGSGDFYFVSIDESSVNQGLNRRQN